ncbi:Nucleoside diphosphate-sugar hydrolase of the MutT (NUDIX) family [Phaffia rhodozyma]|uniref:Nucleoside diphosphate-sugar hydrolase of the MutT (NUDIX) family n=1 Tax=Phaffia rhodozyma TaxID=264483 RepID=A0A0F7SV52_PHARH|nr:Nucleoside diphosphate-sugar hydrolase of the MutT (NUDIX) family [Phaffia rhodozyma]
MSSTGPQKAHVTKTSPANLEDTKFIKLEHIEYTDQDGNNRKWEMACRKTRNESGVDSVAMLAILHHPSRPLSTVIIEQYRPPIDKIVIELPAGLIDPNEDSSMTALRELNEETGYGKSFKKDAKPEENAGEAKVRTISPVIVSDPGMTNANMHLVTIDVFLPEGKIEPPKANLEPGEHIVQRVVELSKLYDVLLDYDKKGFAVDARLLNIAYGIVLTKDLGL